MPPILPCVALLGLAVLFYYIASLILSRLVGRTPHRADLLSHNPKLSTTKSSRSLHWAGAPSSKPIYDKGATEAASQLQTLPAMTLAFTPKTEFKGIEDIPAAPKVSMEARKIAPYGYWESPISLDTVATKTRSLSSPRSCPNTGRSFFVESRPNGRNTIVEITKDSLREVLPEDYSAANSVYEYGASLYDVLPDGRIVFSNKDDSVRILDPDTKEVTTLVNEQVLRYASFSAHPSLPWVLAIEEDHTHDAPSRVENHIVAINIDTAEVKRVVSGADFYFTPRFSPDGKKLSWLEWNNPDLLFDASKLFWAHWDTDASVSELHLVAGPRHESVAEPRWSPDGSLFFCEETTGYRRLFRLAPGHDEPKLINFTNLEHAEFGEVRLFEGSRTYVPLSAKNLIASACIDGRCKLVGIDLETGHWDELASKEELCHVNFDAMHRIDDHSALVVGSGYETTPRVYRFDVRFPGNSEVVRESTEEKFPVAMYSKPERMSFTTKGLPPHGIHGFLWMPKNPDYAAPDGELPPLIINTHGGPTGYSGCGLDLRTQYFTTRGYAVLKLNYTGSTGYGRTYRQALFGGWGIFDAGDSAESAQHLTETGRVRGGSIGVTGLSAGGYNTLQSLARYPGTFAGGFCVSGISDLALFDAKTHKLESHYTPALVLPEGTKDEDKARIYAERSPVNQVDKIRTPLYMLHGTADRIVPLEQARLMEEGMREKGKEVEIKEVEGEGHMMAKPGSARLWLEEEEKWWKKMLL